jgi:hypothetical protein
MVAGKRTAELLHKQHKHELHRQSHPDVCGFTDLFHHKHSNEPSPNPSPKLRHQRPTHAHTIDLSEHVIPGKSRGHHHHKGSKCDLSKPHDKHKNKKSDIFHSSSSMDSISHKSTESCHKPHKWSGSIVCFVRCWDRWLSLYTVSFTLIKKYCLCDQKEVFLALLIVLQIHFCTWRLLFFVSSRIAEGSVLGKLLQVNFATDCVSLTCGFEHCLMLIIS